MIESSTSRVSVYSSARTKSGINRVVSHTLQADNVPAQLEYASGQEALLYQSDQGRYMVKITLPRGVYDLGIAQSWQVRKGSERFDVQSVRPIYSADMQGVVSHVECDCERITANDAG